MWESRRKSEPRFPLSFSSDDVKSPDVAVVGLPRERVLPEYPTGQAEAPNAVRSAASTLDFYDPEVGDPLEILTLVDEGNLRTFEPESEPEIFVVLGGDHSITPEIVQELTPRRLLWLDAHPDLRRSERHDGALRGCLEIVDEVFLVGVRCWSREEYDVFREHEHVVSVDHGDITEVIDDVDYVSLDLDVLDPSVVPGVTTPEPGGLPYRLCADILRWAGRKRAHLDVVELCPTVESHVSPVTAARLVGEYLKGVAER
ncbi:arginase family protein [Methanopyrus kandleri]|uniref:Agmatinase n=1 Tax=Methanopyrus kandleri (strain AV19 / DSM 6324 / JCM 9639 / NBRC 100938) TaxID=190192 RepID=Q8TXD6_METKA|nr:arginase family protein [Methanopyrus kandleri]AAM01952.1 Agmatinase [Methanopyrus kandleri AV19]